jgi:hypothetical protein
MRTITIDNKFAAGVGLMTIMDSSYMWEVAPMSMYRLTQAGRELNYGYRRNARLALDALGPTFTKDEALERLGTLQGLGQLGKGTPQSFWHRFAAQGAHAKKKAFIEMVVS